MFKKKETRKQPNAEAGRVRKKSWRSIVPSPPVILVLITSCIFGNGRAYTIKPGDILVASDGGSAVVKIDPKTGAQSTIGTFIENGVPHGVHDLELSSDGTLYVLEHVRRVTKINVLTGEQKEVTHLGLLGTDEQDTFTAGLTLGPSGDIFVTVYTAPYTGVIRVDPVTGQQKLLASGGFIRGPLGIALTPNGKLVVADVASASLVEVDPIDGSQRLLASGLAGSSPWYLAIASESLIYAGKNTPATGDLIQQINPLTGAHSTFVSGGNLAEPVGLAIDLNGQLISSQASAGKIVRIDPVTKAQSVIASGGFLMNVVLAVRVAQISIPSEPPELTITRSVTISWPIAQGNFALQSSPTLQNGGTWTNLNVALVTQGTNIAASVQETGGQQFFRLAPKQ
ncbi:MAG TPA: hypothetical protein VGR78_04895 [Verrucomicrobiae bacterium]|nr:hypothetical protein [Verrucomicrobiae bacterium]